MFKFLHTVITVTQDIRQKALCFQRDICASFFDRWVWAGRVRAHSRSESGPTLILIQETVKHYASCETTCAFHSTHPYRFSARNGGQLRCLRQLYVREVLAG